MACRIEQIDEVLRVYQQATDANREARFRQGNLIVITPDDADEVMITADLHGNQANFQALLEIAALDAHPARHLILQEVCHGGPAYPDGGGCQSHAMLEEVARLIVAHPGRVHFILSNHELAEITDFPILKGQKMLNLAFRCGLQHAYGHEMYRVRQAYLDFLRSCPLGVSLPGGVFVSHSLPTQVDRTPFDAAIFQRPLTADDYREQGPLFQMVWGRDYRPENAAAFARAVGAKVLIHGHDPCPQGFKAPNKQQIILDCCGTPATYLILPTNEELSHPQLVRRVRYLPPWGESCPVPQSLS